MRAHERVFRRFESTATPVPPSKPNRAKLAAAVLCALGAVATAHAATFEVHSAADSGPDTLRQAVLDANASAGPHSIVFSLPPATTITLTSGQIALTGPDVVMQGPGRDALTISGNHTSRIFDVQAGSLTLDDMTLRDGLAEGDASNFHDQLGGAIRVGPLPPPLTPTQRSARLAAARNAAIADPAYRTGRAHRATALATLRWMQPQRVAGTVPPGLTLDHVALLDNRADAPDFAGGGAICVTGGATLVVRNSVISGNSSPFAGGAILALGASDLGGGLVGAGSFEIADSEFTANHIDQNGAESGQGAAITSYGPGGTITRSVFSNNVINDAPPEQSLSEGIGGALELILTDLPISIVSSEISGNTIELRPGAYSEGAGLYCSGGPAALTITNTTISGNQSEYGAAIEAGCELQLFNTTIAGNISPNSNGAGDAIEVLSSGNFNAASTLIFNPAANVDLFFFDGANDLGTVSNSLIFAADPSTPPLPPDTIIGINPLIAGLVNNGGSTRTHALLPGSPAIDAGSNLQGVTFDQRGTGFARVLGVAPDIGAFESDSDRIFNNGFD